MNCAEFEAQLQHLLDERTPLAELPQPLREAAAGDPTCAQILQAYQALEAALKARPLPQPPSGLAAKVIAGLAAANHSSESNDSACLDDFAAATPDPSAAPQVSQASSGRRGQVMVWGAVAVAASLLITAVYLASQPGTERGGPDPIANHPQDASNQTGQDSVAAVTPQPHDDGLLPRDHALLPHAGSLAPPSAFASLSELAQRQYESLAAETRAGLSDVAVLVPRYELGSDQVVEAPTGEEADLPVDRLRPFKESTRGAVGLLMRFTPR